MIFLIEYDKRRASTISIKRFTEADRLIAANARLARELELKGEGIDREVVLLEADDEAALKRTHARYFETLSEMVAEFERGTSAFVVRERNDEEA